MSNITINIGFNNNSEAAWMKDVMAFCIEALCEKQEDNIKIKSARDILAQNFAIDLGTDASASMFGFNHNEKRVSISVEEYSHMKLAANILQAFIKKFNRHDALI